MKRAAATGISRARRVLSLNTLYEIVGDLGVTYGRWDDGGQAADGR
jgi:hypothetical protein